MGTTPAPPTLPTGAAALVAELRREGARALAVGESLLALARGERPTALLVVSEADPHALLRRLPRAVPTAPGLACLAVPTPTGPVDVVPVARVEGWLGRRVFTVQTLALDPDDAGWIDSFGALDDVRAQRLRCVGSAREALARDPLAALRAARLVATLGIRADAELEAALADAAPVLDEADRARFRAELLALLRGPHVGMALDLLVRSGLQQALAPGALADAVTVVPALPDQPALRLAAWLRGARAQRLLQRWRAPRQLASGVSLLLRHHPVELQAEPRRDASVRRLVARVGPDLPALFALREAELAGVAGTEADAARKRLDALRAAVERVRESARRASERTHLALDGDEVMSALGCGPGPQVGRALRHLADHIAADPSCNHPEALRAELRRWAARSEAG